MGDFTKELNIIDFLGIGLPGCTLILLLGGDKVEALLWANFFGVACSELTRAIILLILGYIVGMLIHEIGDLLEKNLWRIGLLDPKTYAALAVGEKEIIEVLRHDKRVSPEDPTETQEDRAASTESKSKISQKFFIPESHEWGCVLLSLVIAVILLSAFVLLFIKALDAASKTLSADYGQVLGKIFSCTNYTSTIVLIIAVILFLLFYAQKKLHSHRSGIQHVRSQNPYIQTHITGYGSTSKRVLFDGFRITMRNFLIVLMVVNLFSVWKPISAYQQICTFLASSTQDPQHDSYIIVLCYVAVVMLMHIRYCHYSYLKYKYSYEDYLKKHTEPPEDRPPKKGNAH